MRPLSGFLLAGAVLLLPASSRPTFAQAAQKFTIDGQAAVLMVAVNPAKTAEYEQVLTKLKDVLTNSDMPEAKQQAAGWRVVKPLKPQADGTLLYLHLITPVPGADYAILQSIYKAVKDPTEQKALYDTYVGTGAKNVGLLTGTVVLDFSK
jgi:hypothetical protein